MTYSPIDLSRTVRDTGSTAQCHDAPLLALLEPGRRRRWREAEQQLRRPESKRLDGASVGYDRPAISKAGARDRQGSAQATYDIMISQGWSVLRNRDFAIVCIARFSVTLALHITNVAIGWYIYDVTSSAFALGYLGLAGLLPTIALVLVTGYVADQVDRRLILFASDIVLTATAAALLWLVATGEGIVWPVYIIAIFAAAARAFHNPAGQALIPALVPQDQLPSAIAFASGAFQAAQILGPAIGGLLYAIDATWPFMTAAILYGASAIGVLAVRHRSQQATARMPLTVKSLLAGFEFAWNKPVVFGAVSLDAAVVLFGGVVLLLPIFAKDILGTGPEGLGLLRAAPAIGALAMAIWLANNDYVKRGTGPKLFRTIAIYGLATLCFGLSENFLLSMFCLTVVGAADMISVVIRHTMVQAETPDALRGRVAAVNSLFITSSAELGQLRAGTLAGFLGAVPAVVIGGAAAIGLSLLWPWLFPGLASRDHLVDPSPESRSSSS